MVKGNSQLDYWDDSEEVDQLFKNRRGRLPEFEMVRVCRFLSHNPDKKYTSTAIKERVSGITDKNLNNNLGSMARRGHSGLRREGLGQGSPNYYWWANPDVKEWEYVPPLTNSSGIGKRPTRQSRKKEEVTTSNGTHKNTGISKLVAFHLADHPNETFTSKQIAEEFGVEVKAAQNALNTVVRTVPEVKRLSRGVYRWFGKETTMPEILDAMTEAQNKELEEEEKEQKNPDVVAPALDEPEPVEAESVPILRFQILGLKNEKLLLKDNLGDVWLAEKIF